MVVHGQTRMLNAPAVSKSFGSLPFIASFFFEKQNTQLSTVSSFEASPRQAGWRPTASPGNSRECQTHGLFSG
jgi:hypothetical protein